MGFFSDIVGFVTDPIASIATGLLGAKGASDRNEQQMAMTREQMAWQERMSNTAHQREVADLNAVERADSLIEELNKIAEDITQPEEWTPVRGEKVLVKVKGKWHNESPKFYEDVDYVVNDALVEFRKAEKEGKQIQRLIPKQGGILYYPL